MKTKNFFLLIIFITTSFSLNAQIKVFSGGGVSIGNTCTPTSGTKQQVFGNIIFSSSQSPGISAFIRGNYENSSATNPDYTWFNNDQVGLFHPDSNVIGFSTNGVERMRLTSYALQINSSGDYSPSILVNATTANACAYHVTYNSSDKFYVTAGGWACAYAGFWTYSDINFKENISTIPNALNKVTQLRGVNFNYKQEVLNNPDDTLTVLPTEPPVTQIGFIAQEVENIVPEVVKTLHDGTKAVAYQNVVALLVEAIKELNLKVEELQFDLNTCCNIESDIKNKSLDQNGFNNIDSNGKGSSLLFQNTPNPFKESTTISYYIDNNSFDASIFVFDMQGTLLKSFDNLKKGKGSIIISGGEMNAGMYMYSLIVNGKEIDTKRMILTK